VKRPPKEKKAPTPLKRLGDEGERRAALALESEGYTIVERNARAGRGELDIVARDGDSWVFVEVKTRRGDAQGAPEESVTPTKQARLMRAALAWLEDHGVGDVSWRFDVVAIRFLRDQTPDIRIIRNAF